MDRMNKIKVLKDIQRGIPAKFAFNMNNYKSLVREKEGNIYYSIDGTIITQAEKDKYFTDSIVYINVSTQYNAMGEKINIPDPG